MIAIGEQEIIADGVKVKIFDVPLSDPNMMLQIWVRASKSGRKLTKSLIVGTNIINDLVDVPTELR